MSTVWFSDKPCPECGEKLATDGTERGCYNCDYTEEL